MPKISTTKNRVIVHISDLWKRYERHPEQFEFRIQDTGRTGKSERIACKYRDRWRTYAWSFDKSQVRKSGRKLFVYDRKALKILEGLKGKGELKGYSVVDMV